jgi:hypothetical protein
MDEIVNEGMKTVKKIETSVFMLGENISWYAAFKSLSGSSIELKSCPRAARPMISRPILLIQSAKSTTVDVSWEPDRY